MQDRRDDGGFLGLPAWLWSLGALLVGLTLAVTAAWLHQSAISRSERNQLERRAERSFAAVQTQLENCGLLVRTVQALFLASDEVTPREFDSIYSNLRPRELFPSLQAVAYSQRRIDPETGREHFITTMIAPGPGNERLYGLDLATQPLNLKALTLSRDADLPAMSGSFTLIQRLGLPGPSDGITIRLPVYSPGEPPLDVTERRRRVVGSLAVSFRVSKLLESAVPADTRETMDVRVVDITDGQRWPLFYSARSAPSALGAPQALDYRYSNDIRYGGRTWRMELIGHPGGGSPLWFPALTLAGGVLASLLLALLTWSMANTRARALVLGRNMAAQYRESEERFRALNELLPILVLLAKPDGRLVYANQVARERLALGDPDQNPVQVRDIFDDMTVQEKIRRVIAEDLPMRNIALRFAGEKFSPFWATLSVSRIDLDGSPHLLAVANDITELRDLNEMLFYQAAHDPLTGLYNRREFGRRLDAALERVDSGGPPSALLYFDLDQFKIINDTSGHNVGDQLLSQLAALLASHLYEGETLARLGGDEFGILLESTSREQALEFAERMRLEIDGFVFSSEQRIYAVSVSVGLVLLDRPGMSQREVLSLADTACYMAKERGRNRVQLYSEKDADTMLRRSEMEWASRLRQALLDDRFVLHFQELAGLQPAQAGEGLHMELLIRLRDEDGTMVPPGAFIPAAERFGLMLQLDRWVVETAFANFDRLHPKGSPVHMCAINLSALTIEDDTFAPFVLERLQRYGVPPASVCFEITETAAVASMIRVVELMGTLRKVGCKFSLDDFGAGMASFGYLKNLPVDYVKIDGSFIRNLQTDPISASIVRAVTDIGHQLGLKVVAEWVGEAQTIDVLREAGVDYAQGFHVHRPELAHFMR
ncbi:MAG: EAL domain-containing protein [Gammaproteobacteria bacterium]|nr:EAL domain-containing protein [Gammaproteobacteria bacterium]